MPYPSCMTASSFTDGFDQRLRDARERAGYTLRELGIAAEVNYTQISRYEQGLAYPRPSALNRLAEALAVPIGYLRHGEDIQLVELDRQDGSTFATVGFTKDEFGAVTKYAKEKGLPIEDAFKELLMTGIKARTGAANQER